MTGITRTLSTLVSQVDRLQQVYKANMHAGDWLIIKTCNSIYTMRSEESGCWLASGGWFDRKDVSPMRVRINGCTWGGSAIKVDIAAACGLCLEFGNRLVTSPIRRIFLFPHGSWN
jgi:hypothetical protein